jgi:4-hydroxy-tetrahydrodipicolinate reductase
LEWPWNLQWIRSSLAMTHPIRVGLFGLGKAGKEVAGQLLADQAVELCWVVRGSHVGGATHLPSSLPVHVAQDVGLHRLLDNAPVDFVVDFSSADSCLAYADIMAERGVGIISAVSAYQEHHLSCLKNASLTTAVLYSPNITLGINFIIIAGKVLRKLAPHAGVEVIEEHFCDKKEVSGTAIRIAELLGLDPVKQVNSVRVGGIVGRHEIIFGFPYQTIRLIHDSISRAAFGQGALYAIKNLYGRPNGFYTMEQLVSEGFSAALA